MLLGHFSEVLHVKGCCLNSSQFRTGAGTHVAMLQKALNLSAWLIGRPCHMPHCSSLAGDLPMIAVNHHT